MITLVMADIQRPPQCAVCDETNQLKRCIKCRNIFYCSRNHQIKDWPRHKLVCGVSSQKTQNNKGDGLHASKVTTQTIPNTEIGTEHVGVLGTKNNVTNSDSQTFDTQIEKDPENITEGLKSNSCVSESSSMKTESDKPSFDDRPLKLQEFPKPPSFEMADLSDHIAHYLKEDGFCVIDGLVSDTHIERILGEVQELDKSGEMKRGKLAGGRTSGVDSEKVIDNEIRTDRIAWLQGTETGTYPAICELITDVMDKIVAGIAPQFSEDYVLSGRTKAMVTCYPGDGTFYTRHVDNPSKDGRVVTCILYLNQDWDVQKSGGNLRVFPACKSGDYVDVSPILNRLLVFWSDDRNPHEVQPAFAKRYAITAWFYDEVERMTARESQVNQDLLAVQGQLAKIEIQKKTMEKATIERKIEAESNKAISILSEEEIEALGALIEGHPEGRSLLAAMGISPSIVDQLVKHVQSKP